MNTHTRTPETGLEVHALRWHHAGRWLLDGVDFVVRPGEIVGLLGPNGAGKTITLSVVAGLLKPTSGRVALDGEDVTDMPLHLRARRGLGYLPQERSIFTHLSVEDNVAGILQTHGFTNRESHVRARTLLAEFGLAHLARTRAERLSGGEQRRLEVARSLAIDPQYLLFDEPFAGIDPLTIESLHTMLLGLRGRGVGILLTDHNVRETLSLCDRAYVLFRGRILAQGTTPELLANPAVREHFLGDTFELVEPPAKSPDEDHHGAPVSVSPEPSALSPD